MIQPGEQTPKTTLEHYPPETQLLTQGSSGVITVFSKVVITSLLLIPCGLGSNTLSVNNRDSSTTIPETR